MECKEWNEEGFLFVCPCFDKMPEFSFGSSACLSSIIEIYSLRRHDRDYI